MRRDHNPVEATDPAGDGNGAPDITGVTVANDLSGTILFVVEVANRSGFAGKRFVITITATAAGGKAETFKPYAFRVR